MKTKRLASLATSLVAMMIGVGCQLTTDQSFVLNNPPPWPIVVSRPDTAGNCVVTANVHFNVLNGTGAIVDSAHINMEAGSTADLIVHETSNPSGCGTPSTFVWESSDLTRVSVRRVDGVTGRVVAILPGTEVVCAVDERNSSRRICLSVTVPGSVAIPTVAISPRDTTIKTGAQCLRTGQFRATTTNPSGQGVNWSVSGTSSTVNASGLLTAALNGSGIVYLKATTSSGAVDSTSVTLVNTSCATPPMPTAINVEPTSATLLVGQTMSLAFGGPYRVTVTYYDNSTVVNDVSTFTSSSANSNLVSVNSTSGMISALGATPAGTPVILTYCVVGTVICDNVAVTVNVVPTTSTIDYAPTGVLANGDTTLTATCVQGSNDTIPCLPFWTSSDPSRIAVLGNTPSVVSGFWVGLMATMTRVAPGSAVICVQWSLTRNWPFKCYTRVSASPPARSLFRYESHNWVPWE